jgi:hypothetical protein
MPAPFLGSILLAARLVAPEGELVDPGEGEPAVGEIEVPGALWQSLRPVPEVEPGAMILRREAVLRRAPGGVELRATWILRSERAEWFANGLLGPGVHLRRARWNGRPAAVWSGEQGPMVVERIDGAATLEVEAFVPDGEGAELLLPILGAPRGTVTLEGFAADVVLTGDERPVLPHGRGGRLSTGASTLRLAPKPSEPRDRGPLVVASVGLGLTVGDAEVRGRARVRWEIRQGTRASLVLSVSGVGEDLTVEGPQVSRWQRDGGQVLVELAGETTGLVDLELRWSIATPRGAEAKVALPVIVPQDVFRSPAAVQVARDGEVDVRPALGSSWRPLASAQVPAWAEGLVEGTPTAAFVRPRPADGGGDALELLRLEPVPGPPMVVDVADLRIAASEQGRLVARVRYEVRNERASHLAFTPPPGMRVVGVEVAGRRVTPGRDRDSTVLRIPLKRSLETVSGSATVPVTVALLGADEGGERAWARRERRELPLPVVDAPVNVTRVTLHLPPRWRSRLRAGEGPVVEEFDRGQEVAFGLDDARKVAAADRAFGEAVEAWNANEFEQAQTKLDELRALGGAGANAEGLQANVDLVRPRAAEAVAPTTVYDFEDAEIGGDELDAYGSLEGEPVAEMPAPMPAARSSSAIERRIKARVRARSGGKKRELEGRKQKAKQLKEEGQYEAAAAEYRQAIEESKELDRLEDEESVEYDFEADALMDELKSVEARSEGSSESNDAAQDVAEDAASEESGEKDMVSGGLVGLLRALGASAEPDVGSVDEIGEVEAIAAPLELGGDPNAAAEVGPWGLGPLVEVPEIGEVIRYQHLLLEAGERRTVPVDARRRLWR